MSSMENLILTGLAEEDFGLACRAARALISSQDESRRAAGLSWGLSLVAAAEGAGEKNRRGELDSLARVLIEEGGDVADKTLEAGRAWIPERLAEIVPFLGRKAQEGAATVVWLTGKLKSAPWTLAQAGWLLKKMLATGSAGADTLLACAAQAGEALRMAAESSRGTETDERKAALAERLDEGEAGLMWEAWWAAGGGGMKATRLISRAAWMSCSRAGRVAFMKAPAIEAPPGKWKDRAAFAEKVGELGRILTSGRMDEETAFLFGVWLAGMSPAMKKWMSEDPCFFRKDTSSVCMGDTPVLRIYQIGHGLGGLPMWSGDSDYGRKNETPEERASRARTAAAYMRGYSGAGGEQPELEVGVAPWQVWREWAPPKNGGAGLTCLCWGDGNVGVLTEASAKWLSDDAKGTEETLSTLAEVANFLAAGDDKMGADMSRRAAAAVESGALSGAARKASSTGKKGRM